MCDKVICMADTNEQPADDLDYAGRLRRRTRSVRDGSWFALVVFGVIVLAAAIFYRSPYIPTNANGCRSAASVLSCLGRMSSRGLFGNGLGSPDGIAVNVSPWATTYWVISIFAGVCAVVAFYWLRSRSSGVAGRIWPFATVGIGVLVLAMATRQWQTFHIPEDFWIRGMQALLVIAVGLVALAVIERSWPFALFVVGFFGLALLSCLYNVSNLFSRLGIGTGWNGRDQDLPNLILPGVYLIAGGVVIYIARRHRVASGTAHRWTSSGE